MPGRNGETVKAASAPRVAVLMPAYNAAAYIEHTVTSILRQSFDDLLLIAVDDGAKYAVRARLRPKAPDKPQMGVAVNLENFGTGIDVEWLPRAQGTIRKTIPFVPESERDADGFAWYDLGEYDISALQKIPRPTMDGLCLYIQGDVDIVEVVIAKAKGGR